MAHIIKIYLCSFQRFIADEEIGGRELVNTLIRGPGESVTRSDRRGRELWLASSSPPLAAPANQRGAQAGTFNFLRRFFTPLTVRCSFRAISISDRVPNK